MSLSFPAVISAAGIGSRLGMNRPKCLVEVGSRTLLAHQLSLLDDFAEVRVVVGFREELVIEEALQCRRDLVFVRNVDYRASSNVDSLRLATSDLKEGFLSVDGDLWIEPESFARFVMDCSDGGSRVGITKAKSDEAIFVEVDSRHEVTEFVVNKRLSYEWSGVAFLRNVDLSAGRAGYLYRRIEPLLPLPASMLDSWEVDTPHDLDRVRQHVRNQ